MGIDYNLFFLSLTGVFDLAALSEEVRAKWSGLVKINETLKSQVISRLVDNYML